MAILINPFRFAADESSWVELGRSAVSSGSDIDVTVTARDNMMVIEHIVASGNIDQGMHFNDDGGGGGSSNYAWRVRRDGSVTGQGINTYRFNTEESYPVTALEIYYLQHTNGQDKITRWYDTQANGTGATNIPVTCEGVGKWGITSDITKVSFTNIDSGSYASGSEVIVLGYDNDEAAGGTPFWEELASVELGGAGDLSSGTITAKKNLWLQIYSTTGTSADDLLRFNSDTGTNYTDRRRTDNASEATATSQTSILNTMNNNATTPAFGNYFIQNILGQEKLVSGFINQQLTAGATNPASRIEVSGKWVNTSAQITNITLGGTIGAGSIMKVWGAD